MIKIVVVDDHALFRSGLISLLKDLPDLQIVGEASNGMEAIEVIQQSEPEIILLDVNMPVLGGVEAVRAIKAISKAHIIMLTISRSDQDLMESIAGGADGYILKNASPEELFKAIQNVKQGLAVLSPEVTHQVMMAVISDKPSPNEIGLSDREREVLGCLMRGLSTVQIARDLFISENTVKTHIRHVLKKLEVTNRNDAIQKAQDIGFINLQKK